MGRVTLPDHENMSTRSPLRVRGTPAQRQVWQEVGAEMHMTETAFARFIADLAQGHISA